MRAALLDSSIYVSALRSGDAAAALDRLTSQTVLWLSAVVLEELYAGVRETDHHVVEQWERDFDKAGRILVPNLSDWIHTGKVLRRLAGKYDYEKIGRGRLTNDALIAISAARRKIRVITANEKDFRRFERVLFFSMAPRCSLKIRVITPSLSSTHPADTSCPAR